MRCFVPVAGHVGYICVRVRRRGVRSRAQLHADAWLFRCARDVRCIPGGSGGLEPCNWNSGTFVQGNVYVDRWILDPRAVQYFALSYGLRVFSSPDAVVCTHGSQTADNAYVVYRVFSGLLAMPCDPHCAHQQAGYFYIDQRVDI